MTLYWVEASAGCGKTTYLLNFLNQFQENEVLFLTFSKTAANEIKERCSKNIQSYTLHGLCFALLQEMFSFKINNEIESVAIFFLLQNAHANYLINWLLENDKLDDFELQTEDSFQLHSEIPLVANTSFEILFSNELINKNELQNFKDIFFTKQNTLRVSVKHPELINNADFSGQIVQRILLHERNLKKHAINVKNELSFLLENFKQNIQKEQNVLTFDELINKTEELIENENFSKIFFKYFSKINVILIDEAQDLSNKQLNLIFLLLKNWFDIYKTVVVASDSKQLIFEFQNASAFHFEQFKKKLFNFIGNVKIVQLNSSYRLSESVNDYINVIGPKLKIAYLKHQTHSKTAGEVKKVFCEKYEDLMCQIKNSNECMILFKERNQNVENFAFNLMKNGFFLNSFYSLEHPIFKDFQYLIKFLLYQDQFALAVVFNALGKRNLTYEQLLIQEEFSLISNLYQFLDNLEQLFWHWVNFAGVKQFLNEKLGKQMFVYLDVLREYASFYKYNAFAAMADENNFFQNTNAFNSGVFFNTIHAAKGKEADDVFLLEAHKVSKNKIDTHNLLYVALTRAKKNLYIVQLNETCNENSWLAIL